MMCSFHVKGVTAFVGFLLLVLFVHASSTAGSGPGSLTLPVIRNQKYKPSGPRDYARAISKWTARLSDPGDEKLPSNGQTGIVPAWNQTNDKEFLCPVGIGTPSQVLNLDLDTGSSDFWVYSSETDTPPSTRKVWNISESETAQLVNGSTWSITYGDGSYAYGLVWQDSIQLGDLVVPDIYIETAQEVSPSIALDPVMGGIVGLAYNYPSTIIPNVTAFPQLLIQQLALQVVTVDLNWEAEGQYTFGEIDTTRNLTSFNWQPLVDTAKFWQFIVNGYNVEGTNVWELYSWNFIADTGTSLMLLDDPLVGRYYAQINGSGFDMDYGGWIYPCPASLDAVPGVNIGFPGGYVAEVPGSFLMYEQINATHCYGGVQSSEGLPFGILGDVFLKAQSVVFDWEGKQVGFAPKSL